MDGVSYSDREVCGPTPPPAEFHGFVMTRIRELHPSCEKVALGLVYRLDALVRTRPLLSKECVAQAVAYIVYRSNSARVKLDSLSAQIGVPETRLRKEVDAIAAHLGIDVSKDVEDETTMFTQALLRIVRPSSVVGGAPGVARVTRWCKEVMCNLSRGDRTSSVEFLNCSPERQAHAMIHIYVKLVEDPFVRAVQRPNSSVSKCVKLLERAVSELEAAA